MEKWKDVIGYEGKYCISNYGNVKTKARDILKANGKLHYRVKERLLNPSLLPIGYYYVGLHNNGKLKLVTVHSLVANHFLNVAELKSNINHKDGNKRNNHVDNLEWATPSENLQHAYDTGLKPRYSVSAISKNGSVLNFDSVKDAIKLGFTQRGISKSVHKKTHHKGYKFNYISKQDQLDKMINK